MTTTYQPLQATGLCADRVEEIWSALLSIKKDTDARHSGSASAHTPPGELIGGALLNRYLYAICPDPAVEASAERYVDRALAAVHRLPLLGLYGGVLGVAWLLAHMARLDGELADLSDIDDILLAQLKAPWSDFYDLVFGLTGVGFYALERMPHTAGKEILGMVIDRLAEMSRVADSKRVWHTSPEAVPPLRRRDHPKGYHDLGVAHGASGVVRLLAEAVNVGVRSDFARSMLDEAVPFVLSHLKQAGNRWVLPAYAEDGARTASRLAWCYNELGAMTAVLAAGRACGREGWCDRAEGVMRSSFGLPVETSGCRDASLCHGSAGVAHIFQLVGRELGDGAFDREARRWINIVLAMRRSHEGVGEFLYFEVDAKTNTSGLVPNYSFLEGGPGVGLALLSAAWQVEPGWNRLLALS